MEQLNYDIYSAMQEDKPLAIFKKTILGKVYVTVLNPFNDTPEGILLQGDGDKAYIKIWSTKQLSFFENINAEHIRAGRLTKTETIPEPEPSPNIISDEEIDELLRSRFLVLKNRLDKFTDTAPIFRILNRARELEKSEKIINHINSQISALELAKYE